MLRTTKGHDYQAHKEYICDKFLSEAGGDFLNQCVAKDQVKEKKINTKFNLADIFTKPLVRGDLKRIRLKLFNWEHVHK